MRFFERELLNPNVKAGMVAATLPILTALLLNNMPEGAQPRISSPPAAQEVPGHSLDHDVSVEGTVNTLELQPMCVVAYKGLVKTSYIQARNDARVLAHAEGIDQQIQWYITPEDFEAANGFDSHNVPAGQVVTVGNREVLCPAKPGS